MVPALETNLAPMSPASGNGMTVAARLLAAAGRWPWFRDLMRVRHMRAFVRATAGLSRQQIFEKYFERNWWWSPESRSGHGSTLAYTQSIRAAIPPLLVELGIRSVLDAPCGDFNWFQHMRLPAGVSYVGADIVSGLVEMNRQKYITSGRTFAQLDIVKDPLPAADLWLCRAALIHLSDQEIWAALRNFTDSKIRYLLTTTFPETQRNGDIPTGFYRSLNLERPPFSLPPPLRKLDDGISSGEAVLLCLWERAAVAQALARRLAPG